MKLKMEMQGSVAILSVSESIDLAKFPVLRAGLIKLVKSGKGDVLIDLSGLSAQEIQQPRIRDELHILKAGLHLMGAFAICAGPVQGLCEAPTRDEGVALLGSTLNKVSIQTGVLKEALQSVQKKRDEVANLVRSAGGSDFKTVRKENSDLKARVQDLEMQIRDQLKRRKDPFSSSLVAAKRADLESIVKMVLEQEQILPVRGASG